MPKPEAAQYQEKRKLFLVPTFMISRHAPDDGRELMERYWSEVRDHVDNLERSLGSTSHVYHEGVFEDGETGTRMLEALNPTGYSFIKAMCQSSARLEATEDREPVEESSDWQQCIRVGLVSKKVLSTALEGFQQATKQRFERIAANIDESLKPGESGILFIREDHNVQFPSDIQVFYVAPPSLDALKRWIDEQIRSATHRMQQAEAPSEAEEPEEAEELEGPEQEQAAD
jgi:hypothetical protein